MENSKASYLCACILQPMYFYKRLWGKKDEYKKNDEENETVVQAGPPKLLTEKDIMDLLSRVNQ